jgi:hypothetical protein
MSEQNPQMTEGDPPIIVQGGGSVSVTVPPHFNEETSGDKGKDFKNGNVSLVSLQIDGNAPIPLNKNSRITIIYK